MVRAGTSTSCARPPDALTAIKDDVDGRLTYSRYFAKDYRHIPAPERAEGNCATFAATYKGESARRGIEGDARVCRLWDGTGHAYFETKDGHVLDVAALRRHAGGRRLRALMTLTRRLNG